MSQCPSRSLPVTSAVSFLYQPGPHVELVFSLSQRGSTSGTTDWYLDWYHLRMLVSLPEVMHLSVPWAASPHALLWWWAQQGSIETGSPLPYGSGSLGLLRKDELQHSLLGSHLENNNFSFRPHSKTKSFESGWHPFTSWLFLFGLVSLLSQRHLPILPHSSLLKKVNCCYLT